MIVARERTRRRAVAAAVESMCLGLYPGAEKRLVDYIMRHGLPPPRCCVLADHAIEAEWTFAGKQRVGCGFIRVTVPQPGWDDAEIYCESNLGRVTMVASTKDMPSIVDVAALLRKRLKGRP